MTHLNEWMKSLNDTINITELSIPGTHDSITYAETTIGSLGSYHGKCQNLTIKEQLENGIRFFDFRLEKYNDDFRFCHDKLISYKLMFHEIFNQLKLFLKNNPSEFIILSIKKDNGNDFTKEWEEKYSSDAIFYSGDSFPKVSKCRGKIILLSRLKKATKGFPIPWKNNTKDQSLENKKKSYNYSYAVQDNYNVDLEQSYKKITVINTFLDKVVTYKKGYDKATLCLCFVSSSGMFSGFKNLYINLPYPKEASNKINPELEEKIKEKYSNKRLGILIMDFPNQPLIDSIIKSNVFI